MNAPTFAELAGVSAWIAAAATVIGMVALVLFAVSTGFLVSIGAILVDGSLVIPVWSV